MSDSYRRIVENSAAGIAALDGNNLITIANPQIAEMLGCRVEDLIGRGLSEFLDYPTPAISIPRDQYDWKLRRKDGDDLWVIANVTPLRGENGEYDGAVCVFTDITERKLAERKLVHDALTGLPTRPLLLDRLANSLARPRHGDSLSAVLHLDLDRFKLVNDSLGHPAGDKLLVAVARRLEFCVRPGDFVARSGGDEFVLLLEDLHSSAEAETIARRVLAEMLKPVMVAEQELIVTASIGIALCGGHLKTSEDILRDADMAMYRAKSSGKARFAWFEPGLPLQPVDRLRLETDLHRALDRGEFWVEYQPILSLADNKLSAFEALIRWKHPQRGAVSPVEFIPVAEETFQILPIGWWILEEACRVFRDWDSRLAIPGGVTMHVNLSGLQFMEPDLIERIEQILIRTSLDPGRLKLEITETVFIEQAESNRAALAALKDLGVKLVVDDFGTGHSSLSYLSRFPVETLKIAGSFVAGLGNDRGNTEIVRAVLNLSQRLHMQVIAEGIETQAQADMLREMRCGYGQGYLLSQPLKASDAELMLGPLAS
jgi:diguanylate cyclase (GGDEF)-like protein/PAS domain S-box-containing protein